MEHQVILQHIHRALEIKINRVAREINKTREI